MLQQDALAALRLPSLGLAMIGLKGDKVKERLYALRIFCCKFQQALSKEGATKTLELYFSDNDENQLMPTINAMEPLLRIQNAYNSSLWFPSPELSSSASR